MHRIVFDASYLVLGLGDVYLGAPVATPLDPRHRLVTTKYNPARTWTPENAVGIGGAYLCIYGMEGPGGYQFVGRTVQVWNRDRRGPHFEQPWLLRPFDQLRFHPVERRRAARPARRARPPGELTIAHRARRRSGSPTTARFLAAHAAEIDAFRARQQAAFAAERAAWALERRVRRERVTPSTRSSAAFARIAADGRAGHLDHARRPRTRRRRARPTSTAGVAARRRPAAGRARRWP